MKLNRFNKATLLLYYLDDVHRIYISLNHILGSIKNFTIHGQFKRDKLKIFFGKFHIRKKVNCEIHQDFG